MIQLNKPETFFSAVGWISTYSGIRFNVIEPVVDDISIFDIAHALAHQCRYGGHCKRFYSVAEHCIHVAKFAPENLKLEALLHDGSEAYLLDIPRPIKKAMPEYRVIEDRLMTAISSRFAGINWPVAPEVTELDNRILIDEVSQNMTPPAVEWGIPGKALGVDLKYWTPDEAARRFINAFHCYVTGAA